MDTHNNSAGDSARSSGKRSRKPNGKQSGKQSVKQNGKRNGKRRGKPGAGSCTKTSAGPTSEEQQFKNRYFEALGLNNTDNGKNE